MAHARSPHRIVRNINCPVFLFHASDDDRISRSSVIALEKNMQAAFVPVMLFTSETGGHYDSMIATGIPAAIKWLRQQLAP